MMVEEREGFAPTGIVPPLHEQVPPPSPPTTVTTGLGGDSSKMCAKCGHDPACGEASITIGDTTRHYCHASDHSCYEGALSAVQKYSSTYTTNPGTFQVKPPEPLPPMSEPPQPLPELDTEHSVTFSFTHKIYGKKRNIESTREFVEKALEAVLHQPGFTLEVTGDDYEDPRQLRGLWMEDFQV